jgi:hypothetical protein
LGAEIMADKPGKPAPVQGVATDDAATKVLVGD